MEYGEPLYNTPNSFNSQKPPLLSEETKKSILKDISLNPEKYKDLSPNHIECKHSWRRFPLWAHYRDGISRSYCLYCPTIGHFNPFGDVKHYRIDKDSYRLVVTNTSWN